ncbi:MAG: hypothetical protein LBD02_07495 [Christensenellaceae bacterium]|nr:hypothetical protein [Christensenellaceae bacterium]
MTEREVRQLESIQTKLSEIKAKQKEILAKDRKRQRKERTRRLIKIGTLTEQIFNCADVELWEIEQLLKGFENREKEKKYF